MLTCCQLVVCCDAVICCPSHGNDDDDDDDDDDGDGDDGDDEMSIMVMWHRRLSVMIMLVCMRVQRLWRVWSMVSQGGEDDGRRKLTKRGFRE